MTYMWRKDGGNQSLSCMTHAKPSCTRKAMMSEDKNVSDMMSMCSVSFVPLAGSFDIVSSAEAWAASGVVSTGCATMISSEYPRGDLLAIGIQEDVQHVVRCCSYFPDWK